MGILYRLPDPIGRGKAYELKYRTKNKERLSQKRDELVKQRKELMFSVLGKFCSRCNFSDERALQIDHINGFDRNKERRIYNMKQYYLVVYNSVVNNENKYQILCANCNWIKKHENKETPKGYSLRRALVAH